MKRPAKQAGASPKVSGPVVSSPVVPAPFGRNFAAVLGLFLGLCLLKFGGLPIMEKYVERPKEFSEALATTPWPLSWAYWPLGCIASMGLLVARFNQRRLLWLLILPAAWLLWQFLAAGSSVSSELSLLILPHFIACVVCFYLGVFALSRVENLWPFWMGLFCGFLFVVAVGWDQHFGGLQESREFFYHQQQLYPGKDIPPEFLKKIQSQRIYSTLFYPNTLAGALLLFLPPMVLVTLRTGERFRLSSASRGQTLAFLIAVAAGCLLFYPQPGWILLAVAGLALVFPLPRWIAPAIVGLAALACLYWSGSKAGWLLMLLLALVVLLRAPVGNRFKTVVITALLLAGVAGFFVRHAGFFQKGATSVSARFDYWRAAVQTTRAHPLLGTGPGTFAIAYQKIKRPESEMARLVHNDYLEQASDSGIPGFLIYTAFIVAALILAFKGVRSRSNWEGFAVWIGLLGWAAQSAVEFSLYIPALTWPAFLLLGWLLGRGRD